MKDIELNEEECIECETLGKKNCSEHCYTMKTYIFHREGMLYPIELENDGEAIHNAKYNPGTTKVEDRKGNIIFEI